MSQPTQHALVSGGGSGGHVFPGLALCDELRGRGWQVSWAGSERGMEARLVRQREVAFYDLPARPMVGQSALGKLRALVTLGRAAVSARALVRRLDARVVVGTGGYAAAPAVLGGRWARRPVLLVEPNAEAGAANRWLSRLAAGAAVADAGAARSLRCPTTVTGVPVRAEFFAVPAEPPEGAPLRLLVVGGSQGARQLNELVPAALARLGLAGSGLDGGAVAVRHQAGERHLEATRRAYDEAGMGDADVVAFLDDMPAAMAASHLLVSRAGAITLAEICAAGRPSLLVPLALAGGHQAANARRQCAAGAAEMLEAEEASVERMSERLGRLLGDRERLRAMARAARVLGRPGAAAAIADRVEELGGRG